MEPVREKNIPISIKDISEQEPRTLLMTGSTENPDRDGDILDTVGWDLGPYLKNPVVLWAHDYSRPPVGVAKAAYIDNRNKCLVFKIYFPTVDELSTKGQPPSEHALFVDAVYNMYKNGFLNASSVGFLGKNSAPREDDIATPVWMRGMHFTKQELVELSCVPVPANAESLVQARSMKGMNQKGLKMVEEAIVKGAISFHAYPLADEGAAWEAGKEIGEAEVDDLKKMCAWFDPDNADKKSGYKLPHHTKDGYMTVWRGVAAAMGALLGARGGVNIPEADKKGVYNHLGKHYKEFDKEAPEYKSYKPEELKALGFEEEEEMADKLTEEEVKALKALAAKLAEPSTKAGRKLSAASMACITNAVESAQNAADHATKCIEHLKGLTSSGTEEQEGDGSDGVEVVDTGDESNVKPDAKQRSLDLTTLSVDEANSILRQKAEKEGV